MEALRRPVGGLEDADVLEAGQLARMAHELAETSAWIRANESAQELRAGGQRHVPLRLVADHIEMMSDHARGSGLGQQPALAEPRLGDEQERRRTSVDGDRPAEGPDPVELVSPADEWRS